MSLLRVLITSPRPFALHTATAWGGCWFVVVVTATVGSIDAALFTRCKQSPLWQANEVCEAMRTDAKSLADGFLAEAVLKQKAGLLCDVHGVSRRESSPHHCGECGWWSAVVPNDDGAVFAVGVVVPVDLPHLIERTPHAGGPRRRKPAQHARPIGENATFVLRKVGRVDLVGVVRLGQVATTVNGKSLHLCSFSTRVNV
jgi:hypothetical protein